MILTGGAGGLGGGYGSEFGRGVQGRLESKIPKDLIEYDYWMGLALSYSHINSRINFRLFVRRRMAKTGVQIECRRRVFGNHQKDYGRKLYKNL